jgi:hypothetical protein
MRPNKLDCLSLETLSSQVLEFVGKARANQIGGPSPDGSFLGKLLVLPANVRLDWKLIARYKHSSLFGLIISNEGNFFVTLTPDCNVIILLFSSSLALGTIKLECFSLAIFFRVGPGHTHSFEKKNLPETKYPSLFSLSIND